MVELFPGKNNRNFRVHFRSDFDPVLSLHTLNLQIIAVLADIVFVEHRFPLLRDLELKTILFFLLEVFEILDQDIYCCVSVNIVELQLRCRGVLQG